MTLCFVFFLILVSLLQLGPFVDSKHEQIEVSMTWMANLSNLSFHNPKLFCGKVN